MANEMSKTGFEEGVKKLYKKNGEFGIDSKLETLCVAATKMNTENDPSFLRILYEKIEEGIQNGTTLDDLVSENRCNFNIYENSQ